MCLFLSDEHGATMVEYSIMVALIAAVCIIAVTTVGGTTNNLFAKANKCWGGTSC